LPKRQAAVPARTEAGKPQVGNWGFDLSGMDRSVRPGDDFYRFANGSWARRTPIPADKPLYDMFAKLEDL